MIRQGETLKISILYPQFPLIHFIFSLLVILAVQIFLTKILYQSLTKTFFYRNSELKKTKVLLLAPAGRASINIDGTTIHTALQISVDYFGENLSNLNIK